MRQLASLLLLAPLCLLPLNAHAATLFTDGFQSLPTSTASIYSDTGTVGNFNIVVPTDVDFLTGSGNFGYLCSPALTSNCVDLGGSTANSNAMGVISSNVTFGPGTYLVTFLLTGSGRSSTTTTDVSLGSFNFAPITLDSSQVASISQLVTTTASGNLIFTDADASGDPDVGAVLDSATVSSVTPEPSSFVLLGSGMLAGARLVLARRRRK